MRIAINGVGVAGPTLAYWLRRYGHEPVLFEKSEALRTGGYVIDFWGLGYEVAERMGILERVLASGYRMKRLRMVDHEGRAISTTDLAPLRGMLNDRFVSVARGDLSAAIYAACAGIPTHFGVSITDLTQDAAGVTVTLSDGSQDRFDLVVGADGLHSQVRRMLSGDEAQFERHLGCHVAAYRLEGYAPRDELTYVSYTVPERQVARVSLRDDQTLVLLICRSSRFDEDEARSDPKRALTRAFGDMGWEAPNLLEGMQAVQDIYLDRVSQIRLERWSKGRVVLLGDAAACVSLLAGEGTGLAMVEAYVLAGELHRSARDPAAGLAAFEAQLRPFLRAKQEAALRFVAFFAPKNGWSLRLRNAGVRMASHPALARWLVARTLRDDFVLPACA